MLPREPAGSTSASPHPGRPSAAGYAFGPFRLDTRSHRLFRDGEPVAMRARHVAVLQALVAAAGKVVSKDHLIDVGWGRAVTDGSLAKVVAAIRRTLDAAHPDRYITTSSGEGYLFVATATCVEPEMIDVDIYALLAPDRIWSQGLAALETLTIPRLRQGRIDLEAVVSRYPREARFRTGLALTCALLYDSTRADPEPDVNTLNIAVANAHEAVRLAPDLAESWATLAFVLERNGEHELALTAARRATRLDADNWTHQLRLADLSWGLERQNAARATRRLNPGLAMAWFLGATVPVANEAFDDAERMVAAGVNAMAAEVHASARFTALALHYLQGLLYIARGHLADALAALDREIALESRGHIYGRECCANAWYAKGACYLLLGDLEAARAAFMQAIARIAHHPLAWAGMEIVERREAGKAGRDGTVGAALVAARDAERPAASLRFEHEMARAALLVDAGDVPGAVNLLLAALNAAPPGNTGWLIPLDPLLRVWENRDAWAPVLDLLKLRAR